MEIRIQTLTPALEEAYLDFFDHRAFSDGSPYYPCYCNAYNMSADAIANLREDARRCGGGTEGWKRALRESAANLVREGIIRGYLAFDGGIAVGWCNANDRMNYYRVGEFDLDRLPADSAPNDCQRIGQIKSIVCFEISPGYRGRGLAALLLSRVCSDAREQGYDWVEGYPTESGNHALAFTGPLRLYQKAGFREFGRDAHTIVMRKSLK